MILEGLQDFLTELCRCPTRMSTFLRRAGLSKDELESLKYGPTLDSLVLRFCPRLCEWLIRLILLIRCHIRAKRNNTGSYIFMNPYVCTRGAI